MRIAAIVAAMSVLCVHAGLDRIDADGVTETGGAPAYARMLPRTGPDGRLSATLLPPVADWASQPIARLYYASAGATSHGNGSPQYPFSTLEYALAHIATGSAIILAPGTYSGSGSLASGGNLTLFGVGGGARVTSLTILADGSSASTTLDLCGVRVDSLQLNGGRVNVRLSKAVVGTLSGGASVITVTRTDMASVVVAPTVTYSDVYGGYQFVPEAGAVVSQDGLRRLIASGDRARFVDGTSTNTLAHLADIALATSFVHSAMADLRAADAEVSASVAAESSARADADLSLSNSIVRALSALSEDFSSLGSTWGSQLSAINTRIGNLNVGLANLSSKQSNDVSTLNASVSSVRSGYVEADSTLATLLRGEISSSVGALRDDVPGIADTRATLIADAKLRATTNGVISSAVAQANSDAIARESVISGRVSSAQSSITSLQLAVDGHTSDISGLYSADTLLQGQISAANSAITDLRGQVATVSSAISSLQTRVSNIESSIGVLEDHIDEVKNAVNDIIDAIKPLTNSTHRAITGIPDKLWQ